MAYTLLTSIAAGSPAGANFTTGAIDTTGATLLVVGGAYYDPPSPALAISDSKGNTWTELAVATGGGDVEVRLFYVTNPTVGTGHTFTAGGTGVDNRFASIVAASFSGAVTVSPFDQQNGASTTSTTSLATGSVTPSEDNELIVALVGLNGTFGSLAITAGLTIIGQVNFGTGAHYGVGLAYLVQGAAGAINPSWSWTTSRVPAARVATFKAAAAAGGSVLVKQAAYRRRRVS